MIKPATIQHAYIDFDGFFASVEEQARPHLRGKPIGVIPFAHATATCIIAANAKAKQRGIKSGDIVRVFNDRGQLIAGAVVSDKFPEGVIRIQEGAWYGPVGKDGSKEGGAEIGALDSYGDPNTLTLDIGTSKLAQACSAYTCLVDYEKYQGKVPAVSSFSGPVEIAL